MPKNKKTKKVIKKIIVKEIKGKDEIKKTEGEEEETEKDSGTLSDGVLDAFDEVAAVDPLLLEDEAILPEDDEDDELDSGDYRPSDDW